MRVGAGAVGLPVPEGTAMGGYADRVGAATGALDELEVWCVRLGELTLVVADLICVNADVADAVAEAVGGSVWTLATHTHSGPDQNCGPGPRTTPTAWLDAVPRAAAEAAARSTTFEASLAWHVGDVRRVGSIRAGTDAPASVPVDVLAVRDLAGRLVGVLVVLPVHPTVLPATNTAVSADLAGAVRRALRERLDGAWVVVATGCAGDVSTRKTRQAQTPAECARLGDMAAAQIIDILGTEPVCVERGDPPLRSRTRTLCLPIRPTETPELPTGEDRSAHTFRQGAQIARRRREQHPDGITTLRVGTARLGAIPFAAIGAEPYLAVRSMVPAVVFGYANGYSGYLPDETAFADLSYEVLSSPFPTDAATVAITAINEMFDAEDDDD